jgi:hypothetical protein
MEGPNSLTPYLLVTVHRSPRTIDRRGFLTPPNHPAGQECPAYRGVSADPRERLHLLSPASSDLLAGTQFGRAGERTMGPDGPSTRDEYLAGEAALSGRRERGETNLCNVILIVL